MRDAIFCLKSVSERCRSAVSATTLAVAMLGLMHAPAMAQSSQGLNSTSGNLPIGAGGNTIITVTPSGQVNVSGTVIATGPIRVGNDSTACNVGSAGYIRWVTTGAFPHFEGCANTGNGAYEWSSWAFLPPGAAAGRCQVNLNYSDPNNPMGTATSSSVAGTPVWPAIVVSSPIGPGCGCHNSGAFQWSGFPTGFSVSSGGGGGYQGAVYYTCYKRPFLTSAP